MYKFNKNVQLKTDSDLISIWETNNNGNFKDNISRRTEQKTEEATLQK